MGKRSCQLLFVVVICFVCLPLSLADTSCPEVHGTESCSKDKDKEVMECCLKSYKLGFDTLGQRVEGKDPPSCQLDLVSFYLGLMTFLLTVN